jgi:predicted SAM-dependent methyltransferase
MTVHTAIKLNLGCRTRTKPGWLNVDIDPHPGVDIVGDVADLSRFEDGEVSEIYGSHVLEHFPHPQTLGVLKEWARVLEPGGKLYVAVPDFARCVELYHACGLNDWINRFLMGDQEYRTAYHYSLFDEGKLSRLLAEAGFADSYRVEELDGAQPHECSNLVSTHDGGRVSLNMVATR